MFNCVPRRRLGENSNITLGNLNKNGPPPITGSHLLLNEELCLAEAFSKMVNPIAGRHLQLKEQLSLAETDGHFGGGMARFYLSYPQSMTPWRQLRG